MRASLFVFVITSSMVGCTAPSASSECLGAWDTGVDEGEACEARVAALVGDVGAPADENDDGGESSSPGTVRAARSPRDASSGLAVGRRLHQPLP